MEIKKIVLITTGQPSTNPRIVKEADALRSAGFWVTVLYCHFIIWASEADKDLLKNVPWSFKMLGGSPFHRKSLYIFTRVRFKLARLLNKYVGNKILLAERAQARAYDELLKEAKQIKADWYIGHNLGALAIAVKAATYNSAKAGFDFEDYHRGENDAASSDELARIIYLENKYVPQLNYISAASPMIAQNIAAHFPGQEKNIITLLNCFPLSQQPFFREKEIKDKTLKLFWFSQTIGIDRGLEILIDAMLQLNDSSIHLTLAGKCDEDFKQYLELHAISIKDQIHFPGIIPPNDLPAFASKFDVGLALELPVPENRNICLTNKIFTYLMAGNAIIFSGTAMQKRFNEEFNIGAIFPVNNINGLIENLRAYRNSTVLNRQRVYNYELGKQSLNWDRESKALLEKIHD